MDTSPLSRFDSPSTTNSVVPFEATENKIHQMLNGLIDKLNPGSCSKQSNVDVDAVGMATLFHNVLATLLHAEDRTCISFSNDKYIVVIQESQDRISISLAMGNCRVTRYLPILLNDLILNLLKHIIEHEEQFPIQTIDAVLDYILSYKPDECPTLTINAVRCILYCLDEEAMPDFIIKAAFRIFQDQDNTYDIDDVQRIIEMLVEHHEAALIPLCNDAELVLSHPDQYDPPVVWGAIMFCHHCPNEKIPPELKLLAAREIYFNDSKYTDVIIEQITEKIFNDPENCQQQLVDNTKKIVSNYHQYKPNMVRGAFIFFLYCPDSDVTNKLIQPIISIQHNYITHLTKTLESRIHAQCSTQCIRNALLLFRHYPLSPSMAKAKLLTFKAIYHHPEKYTVDEFGNITTIILEDHSNCKMPLLEESEAILVNADQHLPSVVKGTITFFLACSDNDTNANLKSLAAQRAFHPNRRYSLHMILAMAERCIRASITNQNTVTQKVNVIVDEIQKNSVQLNSMIEPVRATCIYIVLNHAAFTSDLIAFVTKTIVSNQASYPKIIVAWAFIKHNDNFFKAAAFVQTYFVEFYTKLGKFDQLKKYSKQLIDALCSDDSIFEITKKDQGTQYVTILALWNSQRYLDALAKNPKIVTVILNNINNDLITDWIPISLPTDAETDEMGLPLHTTDWSAGNPKRDD